MKTATAVAAVMINVIESAFMNLPIEGMFAAEMLRRFYIRNLTQTKPFLSTGSLAVLAKSASDPRPR